MQLKIKCRLAIKKQLRRMPVFKNATKDKIFLKEAQLFLKTNFNGYKNSNWHHYYSVITGLKSVEFIPEDLYFTEIEPVLTKNDFAPAIADKLSLDTLFNKEDMPETIFKVINGRFYTSENNFIERETALQKINNLNKKIIIKPSEDSGGGKNIIVAHSESINKLLDTKHYLKDSFIIQEFVKQHKTIEQFHPNSLNTCRITTARVGSEIVVLSAFFRTGNNNSMVDNGQAGGIMCGIKDDGKLSKYAINKSVTFFEKHPFSKIKFEGNLIPNYQVLKEFCIKNHKRFLRFTIISWDMTIREDGRLCFIEFNPRRQGINNHQILNGPLFGEYFKHFVQRYNDEKDKILPPKFVI